MSLSLHEAQQAIAAAIVVAERLQTEMCIAVLDAGACLKAFARMEEARIGCVDVAIKKAKTACVFNMPSGEVGKLSQPNKPWYGIEHSNDGLITFPGGLPIVNREGLLLGAIGVSGSSVENDLQVAMAGAAAVVTKQV